MSRTISVGTQAEIAKPDAELGYLVEIAFASFTLRVSTYGIVIWNGFTFSGLNMKVDGLDSDASRAVVRVFDTDTTVRTLCLTDNGARNRPVRIWKFYRLALGVTDPMLLFVGVGDEVNGGAGYVEIQCARQAVGVAYAPRRRLGPATGCHFMAAPGTIIPWGSKTLHLEPSRG